MKKVYTLLIILLVHSLYVCVAAKAQSRADTVRTTINIFSKGIIEGNLEMVKKSIAADFSLAEATYPRTNYYINDIINKKIIKSIEFGSVDSVAANILYAKVLIKNNKDKVIRSIAALNEDNDILFIDYLDRLAGESRYNKSRLVGCIPFELKPNNQIILTAYVEDYPEPLKFLFDSGASGFAITAKAADLINLPIANIESVSVVGGSMNLEFSSELKVKLSDKIMMKQSFAVFEDFDNLGLDGIIGLSIAYSYIINIDFDNQIMSFYTMGNYPFEDSGTLFSTTVRSGTMHIDGYLNITGKNGVFGDFIIDTGADYFFIGFNNFVNRNKLLQSGFKVEHRDTTESLGKITPIVVGNTKKFSLGDQITISDMPIVLQTDADKYHKEYIEVDGSVGIRFISQFNMTIDLLRKKLHLKPRDTQDG